MVGRVMKRVLLQPRVKRATWEQLCSAAAVQKERFEAMLSQVTEQGAAVTLAGMHPIRDIVAHLAEENRRTAAVLESLRAGKSASVPAPSPYAGALARTIPEVSADYNQSWRQLAQAAAQPITSALTSPHSFFGPLNAAEWLALVGYNLEFHARQIERIMRSEAYRKVQGAPW
jgi:hypothetical protein